VISHQRKIAAVVSRLMAWYPMNARDLPWRKTADPYRVFVSEIMLQQTQVKTVLRYWEPWMRALPDVAALAAASPAKIHKLWEGLGYYTRVRNMQKAARVIMAEHNGKFPETFDEILALPGVGRYTAGAICSIAMGLPKPILDGNVIRVLTRLFGIKKNPRETKTNKQLWELAEALVRRAEKTYPPKFKFRERGSRMDSREKGRRLASKSPCSQFNQSLMELGALVCKPKNPVCETCPLKALCVARKIRRVNEIPNLGKRAAVSRRRFVAFVVEKQGRFLVRQRPPDVVNAHLWEFPNAEIEAGDGDFRDAAVRALGRAPSDFEPLCTIKHSITRYRITLEAFRAPIAPTPKQHLFKGTWVGRNQMNKLAFSSAHKRIIEAID
jgi:A/G-specific adenine glycosylase